MKYIEESFLLKLYRELYKEKSVIHSGDKGDNKFEMVHKYLKRLESSEKVYDRDKKSALEYLKNRYYDKYVIKEKNIKDKSSKDVIIKKQRESLSSCLDYLLGNEEARKFPVWVRYWAFQGIVKMGTYNGETNSYSYRTDKTTSSFLILNELNVKSLNQTMQMMVDYLGNELDVSDDYVNTLIKNGKFSTLFAYNRWQNISKVKEGVVSKEIGIWKKYSKGSDVSELKEILDKHITHWCIEDAVIMEEYNKNNDMEIYYMEDEEGNYSIPKVAIVTNDQGIKEIRGVADFHENIDGDLVDVVEEKIKDTLHDSKFDEMIDNVKKINNIYDKYLNKKELSIDDLKFLYEIDSEIITFGRSGFYDVRINTIKKSRDAREDYANIFGCKKEEVGLTIDELLDVNKKLEVYIGNVKFEELEIPSFSCPKIILGNLECPYVSSVPGFDRLEIIYGDLICPFLEETDGLKNLREVRRNAYFGKLNGEFENLKLVAGEINYSNETLSDYLGFSR